jgi:hypothetical protein
VPITTNVFSSNPTHGEVYSIQHYVIKFVPPRPNPLYKIIASLKALLHGKASIAILVSWFLSVYTLNQVACFMQFVYKLFSPKWRILTMKTLSYKLSRLSGHLFLHKTFACFRIYMKSVIWRFKYLQNNKNMLNGKSWNFTQIFTSCVL